MLRKLEKIILLSFITAGSLHAYLSDKQCDMFKKTYGANSQMYNQLYVKQGMCKKHKEKTKEELKKIEFNNFVNALRSDGRLRTLISEGGNVNIVNEYNESPLLIAANSNSGDSTIKILLSNGANINHLDDRGNSALIYAVLSDHYKVVKVLLKNNANINQKNKEGNTALYYADNKGHKRIVDLLIVNGPDLNLKNSNGLSYKDIRTKFKNKYFGHYIKVKDKRPICDERNKYYTGVSSRYYQGWQNFPAVSYNDYLKNINNQGCFIAKSNMSETYFKVWDAYKQMKRTILVVGTPSKKYYVALRDTIDKESSDKTDETVVKVLPSDYSHIKGSKYCDGNDDVTCKALLRIEQGGTTLHDKMTAFQYCRLIRDYSPYSNFDKLMQANHGLYQQCENLFSEYNNMLQRKHGINNQAKSDIHFLSEFKIFLEKYR